MDSSNYHVEGKRPSPSSSSAITEELKEQKKIIVVRYKECLKNHAASLGGHAIDGCGEFISSSSSEDGSLEAFKCSACNCHRNFHRKEIQYCYSNSSSPNTFCYSSDQHFLPNTSQITNPIIVDHLLLSPNKTGSNLSDQSHDHDSSKDHDHGEEEDQNKGVGNNKSEDEKLVVVMKKRFRTKFSAEQKEKMVRFADKVGWKMQKVEESVVRQFCEEIGIKRRVLRVWMHNNKNTYAKNL